MRFGFFSKQSNSPFPYQTCVPHRKGKASYFSAPLVHQKYFYLKLGGYNLATQKYLIIFCNSLVLFNISHKCGNDFIKLRPSNGTSINYINGKSLLFTTQHASPQPPLGNHTMSSGKLPAPDRPLPSATGWISP